MNPGSFQPEHFQWRFADGVATVTLNRPERKNPLTFESYAELRDLFRALVYAKPVKAVIVAGAGGNFSSGGDVHEIIGPLTEKEMPGLLEFTRMTGDLVKAMRACPQPIIAALDGVCVGRARSYDGSTSGSHARSRPLSCSPASALPAATWAPARSCLDHRPAGPRNCCSPAGR